MTTPLSKDQEKQLKNIVHEYFDFMEFGTGVPFEDVVELVNRWVLESKNHMPPGSLKPPETYSEPPGLHIYEEDLDCIHPEYWWTSR
jgi:hypothetical protein